jgi:hypothetical protein
MKIKYVHSRLISVLRLIQDITMICVGIGAATGQWLWYLSLPINVVCAIAEDELRQNIIIQIR